MTEIQAKLGKLRALMLAENITALHLRGVDWFSWITAGGSSVVILTNEVGIAEVFVTANKALVLTNKIEKKRLMEEELSPVFEVVAFPWQQPEALSQYAQAQVGSGRLASDRPQAGVQALPRSIWELKLQLLEGDILRYRKVGRLAAEAMTDALTAAKPDWTENQLAGEGARQLLNRGLEPTLVLVAGEERGLKYRHPLPKNCKLQQTAMMVFCARGFGLYANLTRFVYFRSPNSLEERKWKALYDIEGAALQSLRMHGDLDSSFAAIKNAYAKADFAEEIDNHHQGGPTGYLSREQIAGQGGGNLSYRPGMAFAWNPSLPGVKLEDTVLLHDSGLEILTQDPRWPTKKVLGLDRPEILLRGQ